MKPLLVLVIIFNSMEIIGKFILSFVEHENKVTAVGAFFDASLYSVSLIILSVFALKLTRKFEM
jgi:hypothetical protein